MIESLRQKPLTPQHCGVNLQEIIPEGLPLFDLNSATYLYLGRHFIRWNMKLLRILKF